MSLSHRSLSLSRHRPTTPVTTRLRLLERGDMKKEVNCVSYCGNNKHTTRIEGISADGVDVNTGNRHHSVWPVLTVIYNLPLKPLVDDLHTLFETGVDTYDASTKDNFNLRAIVLWTINDYPALGTLCGCPYSGFKGCVVCGKDTNCVRLSASSKQTKLIFEHNPVPHCVIDIMHVEKKVAKKCFAMQDEDKTTLPSSRNKPEGCIAEETIAEETIEFFSEYHKSMETIGIPPGKHETYENEEGKPLSAGKSSEVSAKLFQKAHLYVIQNTDEIVPYIE
ncbi:putative ribonuclease H-like domain-containing protein [Tanacetum coccineum]